MLWTRKLNLALIVGSSALLAVYAGACSSDTSATNGTDGGTDGHVGTGDSSTPPGDTGTGGDSTPPGDDSSTGDGSVGDGGTEAGGAANSFAVTLSKSGAMSGIILAAGGPVPAANPNVMTTTMGPCVYSKTTIEATDASAVDAGEAGVVKAPNAGVITVTGGALAAAGVMLTPDGTTGAYPFSMDTTGLWAMGGASMEAKAAGADIMAFDLTVKSPDEVVLTAPAKDDAAVPGYSISEGADLAVTWTGGNGNGNVDVSLARSSSTMVESLTCTFGSMSGTGTIPKAALAQISTGTGFFTVTSSNAATPMTLGEWSVGLNASQTITSGSLDLTQ
jgi:hypothetical protein